MTEPETEQAAEEVLEAHDMHDIPVDPFAIARLEGISLAPGDYDGCFDGRIEYRRKANDGRFYLFYQYEDALRPPSARVRFSVAHELGHFYLPEHRRYLTSGLWHGSRCGFVSDKPTEREADLFAAALLMPKAAYIRHVKMKSGCVCTMKDLVRLADKVFQTSVTSTAIRYAQLNFEPCCVVLSQAGQVLYSVRSEDIKRFGLGWLDRGSRVPASTITGRMLSTIAQGGMPQTEGSVQADAWFEGRRATPLWEEAFALGNTGLVLTQIVLDAEEEDE